MRSSAVPKTRQDLRINGGKLLLLVSTRFFICLEQILVFSSTPEQPPSPTCARTPQSCQTSFSHTHSAFKELWRRSVTAQHKCSLSEMQSWKRIGKSGTKLYCQRTPCHGEIQDILNSTSPGGHQYFYSSSDNGNERFSLHDWNMETELMHLLQKLELENFGRKATCGSPT